MKILSACRAAARLVFPLAVGFAALARGEIARIEIQTREAVADGRPYGHAGPYERVVGMIHFEVDPANRANRVITDIDYAPKNERGRVEFSGNFFLLRPKQIERGNGTLLIEISNRGRKSAHALFNRMDPRQATYNPRAERDLGDGFLMTEGFSVLWVGWQFDVSDTPADLMRLAVPAAVGNGTAIEGLVRSGIIVDAPELVQSLGNRGHRPYPVLDPADPRNVLLARRTENAPRQVIPRDQWSFSRLEDGRLVPDRTHLHLASGFQPGTLYEIIYTAGAPAIAGLGLAAIRDAASGFKHGGAKTHSLTGGFLKRTVILGVSQSGRFLRQYLFDGFNEDEQGRVAADGLMIDVAGSGRGSFNHRFAQPSHSTEAFSYPIHLFPFTDRAQTDPVTGVTDGLLTHAGTSGLRTRIFHLNAANEYLNGASLIHTTPDGTRDVEMMPNARLYAYSSGGHQPEFPFSADSPAPGPTGNFLPYTWSFRSLLLAMHRWIADDVAPPASRYPRIDQGTLVPSGDLSFPKIPGLSALKPPSRRPRLDFGPGFAQGVLSKHPPEVGPEFAVRVPRVDEDGNEMGGIRMPELVAPLGTFTSQKYLPFPRTAAKRQATRDPRRSIAERYASRQEYLGQYAAAAQRLADEGYLLQGDLPRMIEDAGRHWDWVMKE